MAGFIVDFVETLAPVIPWGESIASSVEVAGRAKDVFEGVKIGIIIVDFYRFDSITTSASEYAIALNQMGCNVDIICNNLSGIAAEFLKPRDEFDPQEYDLLFYHYYIGDPLITVVSACSVPKICFFHGVTTPAESYLPYSPELYQICDNGLNSLDELCKFDLVVSAATINVLQVQAASPCEFKGFPYKIIPPIVSLSRFEGTRTEPNSPQVNVITVGRVFSSKNIEGVIKFAYELECRLEKKVSLTIAGSKIEPTYLSSILSVTENQQPASIVISLRPSDTCLQDLYEEADVFATFSHHEGFCIPLVESMAAELLVVSHNVAALPETMKGTGIMVDGYDYKQAADGVAVALGDDFLMTRLVGEQKAHYLNVYSEKVVVTKIIQMFESFICDHLS